MERTPFYEMFKCCAADECLYGILNEAYVIAVFTDEASSSMNLTIEFPAPPAPVILGMMK